MTQFLENFRLAIDALLAHKLRAFLAILGIIIGVLTIITMSTIISGANKYVSNEISGLGSDVLYIDKFPWFTGNFEKIKNRKNITERQGIEVINRVKNTQAITYSISRTSTIKFGNNNLKNVRIVGTTETYQEVNNTFTEQGRFLIKSDIMNRRHVCIIGPEIVNKFFDQIGPLGKQLKINGVYFNIVGVLEKKGKFFGVDMDNIIIIPFGNFEKLYGTKNSITIAVKTGNPEMIEEMKEELKGIMRIVRKLPPLTEDDFSINQQDMFSEMYENITSIFYTVAIGIGAISLLVGGIGIMNIMLVTITERTREIGIRKAVGAKRSNIMVQFVMEAVCICLVGGISGIILGLGVGILIGALTPLPASISLWSILAGLTFTTAIGLFFGIYPAAKAAKLKPIEALRHE